MHRFSRSIYRLLLRLHPTAFRNEFAQEMAFDFEEALHTYGILRLFCDAFASLARQWSADVLSTAPIAISGPRPSLLAGHYAVVCDSPFTPLELGLGLIASSAQIALCLLMFSVGPRHIRALPIASPHLYTEATDRNIPRESPLPASTRSGVEKSPAQAAELKPELLLLHPSDPLPSYEVATIKLLDPEIARSMVKLPPGATLSPLTIRRFLMDSYGARYATQVVGGPEWLNKDEYRVEGKNTDDQESAFQKMPREDHYKQIHLMGQSLLADRFHLKAHFETRILPVYALEADKGGLKITAVPAPPEIKPGEAPIPFKSGDQLAPGHMETNLAGNGARNLNGRAIQMSLLARILANDIGDRPIVNHTGFTGYFDVTDLTWAPLTDAPTANQSDAPSLPGALKERLGVRIVSAKAPIEVLVIDSIERPTPN